MPQGLGTDPFELDGNAHADFVRRVAIACLAVNVIFIIEHPSHPTCGSCPAT